MPAPPADTARVWTRRVSKPGRCRIRPTLDRQRTGRLRDHQRGEQHEPRRILPQHLPEASTGVPQPHHRAGRPYATSSHHGARSSNVVTLARQTPISTRTRRRPQAGLVRRQPLIRTGSNWPGFPARCCSVRASWATMPSWTSTRRALRT
jgi:hypothetical protein